MAPARKSTKSVGRAASTASSSNTPASPVKASAAAAAKKAPSASPAKKTASSTTSGKKVVVSSDSNIKPARYYAQIPLALRSKAKATRQGVLSKLAASFLGRKPTNPTRDFPFMTAAGPQYFCTDKKIAQQKFGVSHNDRLYYTAGPLARTYCSVVGIRGGLLWVVNDVTKKGYDGEAEVPLARPDFAESSSLFDFGYATPLVGINSAEDLEEAGIEFHVRGGTMNRTEAVDDFPQPLIDFLKYAPDLTLKLPNTTADGSDNTLIVPPLLTPTGEIGWSTAGSFASFVANSDDSGEGSTASEARALVSIVPMMVPAEYLSDAEEEEE